MQVEGIYCLPLELRVEEKDEVRIVWDFDNEEYIIPSRNGQGDEVLHEDGSWRKPTLHALAQAWGTLRSMNRRHEEGRQRRK